MADAARTGDYHELCLRFGLALRGPEGLAAVERRCSRTAELDALRPLAEGLGLDHAAAMLGAEVRRLGGGSMPLFKKRSA